MQGLMAAVVGCQYQRLETAYGTGTTTDPPSTWKIMQTYAFSFPASGNVAYDVLEIAAGQYGGASGTITVRIDNITVRQL